MPPKKDQQKLSEHEEGFVAVFAGEKPPRSEPQPTALCRTQQKSKRDEKGAWTEKEKVPRVKKAAPKPVGKRVVHNKKAAPKPSERVVPSEEDSGTDSSESEADVPKPEGFRPRKRSRPVDPALIRHGITLPRVNRVVPKDSLWSMTKRPCFGVPTRPFHSYLYLPCRPDYRGEG